MFQVVVQSAMRQLKAKLKLRAPPSNLGEEKTPQEKIKIELVLFWPWPLAVEYCCWPCFLICQTPDFSGTGSGGI